MTSNFGDFLFDLEGRSFDDRELAISRTLVNIFSFDIGSK